MNSEWKDGHFCLPYSSALDIGVHDKNKDIGLGKANNKNNKNKTTTKKSFMSSYFGEK